MSPWSEVARVGAAVFLLIQLVILLGSVYEINDRWLGKATGYNEGGGKDGFYRLLLVISTFAFYIGSFVASGFMYARWAPYKECVTNNLFITFTLLLAALYTAVSLRSDVRAGQGGHSGYDAT